MSYIKTLSLVVVLQYSNNMITQDGCIIRVTMADTWVSSYYTVLFIVL